MSEPPRYHLDVPYRSFWTGETVPAPTETRWSNLSTADLRGVAVILFRSDPLQMLPSEWGAM